MQETETRARSPEAIDDPRFATRARAYAVAMVAAGAACVAGAFVLARPYGSNENLGLILPAAILVVAYVVPGALIALRQPRNAVGWVLGTVGLLFGILTLSASITEGEAAGGGAVRWIYILTEGAWAPPIFTLLSVLPLIFPDGRVPSRRWRVVIWLGTLGSIITMAASPFDPQAIEGARNPIGNETLFGISGLGPPLGLAASLAAMAGMVLRFRRARGIERDQLKLLVSAVVVAVLTMVANGATIGIIGEDDVPGWIQAGGLLLSASILSVAVSVATLRHRLFDINVVISKALVFGALGVLVTGLYVGFVAGIGALAGRGDEPNLGLSIAATAIAALAFQPLRARAQHLANRLVYGKRATPYEVLAHLSDQFRETYASEDVLGRMARSLAEGTGATTASVWMRTGDVLWTAASWPAEMPKREVKLAGDGLPALDASVTAPVEHAGELLGALTITKPPSDPPRATEERLVTDLGAQAGLVLRNARLTTELLARLDELKASRQRLVKAQDEERRRLERDLHDGAQQTLVALKVKLGLATKLAQEEQLRAMLGQMQTETGEALDTVRDLARGIYPPLLASDGLVAALTSQASKATIPVEIEAERVARYREEVEAAVYFCVLEALQNVQKYAGASRAIVRLLPGDDELRFEVSDDGRGFDPATTARGSGTQNMADRLGALEGSIEVRSQPGAGATVVGTVPLPSVS